MRSRGKSCDHSDHKRAERTEESEPEIKDGAQRQAAEQGWGSEPLSPRSQAWGADCWATGGKRLVAGMHLPRGSQRPPREAGKLNEESESLVRLESRRSCSR